MHSAGRSGRRPVRANGPQDATRRTGAAPEQWEDAQRETECKGIAPALWVTQKLSDEQAVKQLYLLALCREPSATELTSFTKLLAEASASGSRREAMEDLFWAVLTSREFVFNR